MENTTPENTQNVEVEIVHLPVEVVPAVVKDVEIVVHETATVVVSASIVVAEISQAVSAHAVEAGPVVGDHSETLGTGVPMSAVNAPAAISPAPGTTDIAPPA